MPEGSSTDRLVARLREDIGRRRPGERLPSSRELVETLHLSPVTVSRAIGVLDAEGVVEVRPGAGTFVADRPPPTPLGEDARSADLSWQSAALGDRTLSADGLGPLLDPPRVDGAISLATGYPHPSLTPSRLLGAAWTRAARLPDAFDRAPVEGLASLRAWFARTVAPGVEPRDVLITPGGQAAITSAVRAVLGAGDTLLVESPTYPGILAIARAAGIRTVPVPVDAGGISVAHLADAFERTRARALYIQPTFQNPTGTVLAHDRRAAVLDAATAAGAFLIEDDFARWLSHGPRPAPPLLADDREGRVIHVDSLTKATAPSLRIGSVIARGPVAERIRTLRVVEDLFVPRPAQVAALDLVSGPGWERHQRVFAEALRERAAAMSAGLRRHVPELGSFTIPAGGMHLWLKLRPDTDEHALTAAARDLGVLVNPGRPFHAAEPPGPHLRLTFSSVAGVADIDEGLRRLALAVSATS